MLWACKTSNTWAGDCLAQNVELGKDFTLADYQIHQAAVNMPPHQPKNVTWMISKMEPSWIEPINVTNCPNQVHESQHNHVLTGVTADQKGSQRGERNSFAASFRSRGTDTGRLFLLDPEVVAARSEKLSVIHTDNSLEFYPGLCRLVLESGQVNPIPI